MLLPTRPEVTSLATTRVRSASAAVATTASNFDWKESLIQSTSTALAPLRLVALDT